MNVLPFDQFNASLLTKTIKKHYSVVPQTWMGSVHCTYISIYYMYIGNVYYLDQFVIQFVFKYHFSFEEQIQTFN